MGFVNQPLTNEAARKLMVLDVQDKEILTYEKVTYRFDESYVQSLMLMRMIGG